MLWWNCSRKNRHNKTESFFYIDFLYLILLYFFLNILLCFIMEPCLSLGPWATMKVWWNYFMNRVLFNIWAVPKKNSSILLVFRFCLSILFCMGFFFNWSSCIMVVLHRFTPSDTCCQKYLMCQATQTSETMAYKALYRFSQSRTKFWWYKPQHPNNNYYHHFFFQWCW